MNISFNNLYPSKGEINPNFFMNLAMSQLSAVKFASIEDKVKTTVWYANKLAYFIGYYNLIPWLHKETFNVELSEDQVAKIKQEYQEVAFKYLKGIKVTPLV